VYIVTIDISLRKNKGEEKRMKILSIEISERITKVLETDYKKESPKVYNCFAFKTPKDVVVEGKVMFQKEFRIQLLQHLAEKGIQTKKAIFVVNSAKIASRMVEIPNVKENKIQSLLEENINDYFPVDLEQYQISYRLTSDTKAQKGQMLKLFVIAVPKDIIGSYYNLAQQSGLEFVCLDYEGNSIYQIIKSLNVKERQVYLEIGESSSTVTIANGHELEMQRTFYYGLGEVIDKIKTSSFCEGDSFSAQLKAVQREQYVHAQEIDSDDHQLVELRSEIEELIQPVVNNITRIIKYFSSQDLDAQLAGCTLIGIGAYFRGFRELLEEELGLSVSLIDDHAKMLNRKVAIEKISEGAHLASYLVSLGAVIDPMNLTIQSSKKDGQGFTIIPGDSLSVGILVLVLGVVASAALIASVLIPNMQLKTNIKEFEIEKRQYASAKVVQGEHLNAQNCAKDMEFMEKIIRGPANEVANILEEMEDKLPSNSYAASISVDEAGIVMAMTSSSKNEVAKVLEQLKTIEEFSEVTVSSLSSEKNDSGQTPVKYTITCNFPKQETVDLKKGGN
jgi:type IV pilus assembly protein PilN